MSPHAIGDDEEAEIRGGAVAAGVADEDEEGVLVVISFHADGLCRSIGDVAPEVLDELKRFGSRRI